MIRCSKLSNCTLKSEKKKKPNSQCILVPLAVLLHCVTKNMTDLALCGYVTSYVSNLEVESFGFFLF